MSSERIFIQRPASLRIWMCDSMGDSTYSIGSSDGEMLFDVADKDVVHMVELDDYYALLEQAEKLASTLLWISGDTERNDYCTYYERTLDDGRVVPTANDLARESLALYEKFKRG